MSELIDRLDALALEAEELDAPMECDEKTKRIALGLLEAYPGIRAEVLRLEEERVRAIAERDWAYTTRAASEKVDGEQIDALVEALKESVEAMEYEVDHSCFDDGPDEPCLGITGLLEAITKARAALPEANHD